jgi:DNA replication ATP-dependent helicase Dna2
MFSTFAPPEKLSDTEPIYTAPTGPLWRAGAAEILEADAPGEDIYLVRRLAYGGSMLHVGPLLEQVTRFDHPRMWGPSYWTRGDDGIWIASLEPRGVRLEESEVGRCSFAEALELWRPLAEAVMRLHRRGMVHGQLTPWTTWLDEPTRKLTALDAGVWIADALHDLDEQAVWLADEMRVQQPDPGPSVDIYGLARLLLRLTLPAEQAARARPSLNGIPGYAIPALDAAIHPQPSKRPARVAELITATTPRSLHESAALDDGERQTLSVLHARVSEVERIEHPDRGEGVKFYLNRQTDSGQAERLGAFFYESQDPEVYESVRWVWEGCELNLLDARVVENSSGERFLTSSRRTLPVLEPHMPMSVSSVLAAEGCPSRFLVDQRDRGGSSRPLVFGNLVHGLLDDLAEAEPPGFEQAYTERIKGLRLDMLAAGLADADLGELRQDARQHFDNISRFTAPRTDEAGAHDRVGWSGRNVEVTRYSTRYGIEGRIDLVAEDEREGLQLVELKSGSTWDGHLSQLRFYRFLWQGLAEARGLEISGHLMYSRHGRMQAAPMEDTARERRILRARNELVACLKSFVDPGYEYRAPAFMDYPRNCRSGACKFRRDRCRAQTEALGLSDEMSPWEAVETDAWSGFEPELVARAWAWHAHFARLIEMERWSSTAALGAVLHPDRLEERRQNYAASGPMRIDAVRASGGSVDFVGEHGEIFSPGDYVVAHRGDFETSHILRGRTVAVDGQRLTLSSPGAPIAATLAEDGWIIDKLPARLGFRQAHHALYGAIARAEPDRLEVLFRPESARAKELARPAGDVEPGAEATSLNKSQTEALQTALAAPQAALIQGPPGTGKTTVIAHLIAELVERGQRVVVSAFTNTAVDTVLAKLLEVGCHDFLRVGRSSRSPDLVRALEANDLQAGAFFSEDLAAKTESLDELRGELLARRVVASTAHRCVSSSLMEFVRRERGEVPFDVAIVDEAAQITEPMTLAALNLGERFVLVGDHRQLPPIVDNEQAHSNFVAGLDRGLQGADDAEALPLFDADERFGSELSPELEALGCAGLDQSLFERLVDKLPHVMLEEQYRMHADIMAFSNRNFYGERLVANESVRAHTLTASDDGGAAIDAALGEAIAPANPLVFVDVDHDGQARHNRREAEAVVEAASALLANSDGPTSVGIISPFRAQVYLIRRLLAAGHPRAAEIDVDTVERFQGSERDAILVSLVKTERAGDFLADERRLNVTLTRAKKKLIVFGSRACLQLNPLYRRLIEQPETKVVAWTST